MCKQAYRWIQFSEQFPGIINNFNCSRTCFVMCHVIMHIHIQLFGCVDYIQQNNESYLLWSAIHYSPTGSNNVSSLLQQFLFFNSLEKILALFLIVFKIQTHTTRVIGCCDFLVYFAYRQWFFSLHRRSFVMEILNK